MKHTTRIRLLVPAGIAVLVVALAGCQTTKPSLVAAAESAIQVEKSGFFPGGTPGQNSIEISLLYGNGDSIDTWKVEVAAGSAAAARTWTGNATYLPASITWDGKTEKGAPAAEGTYTARLSISYKEKYQPSSVQSRSFVLDVNPPTGSIAMDPPLFTPTEGQGPQTGVQGPMKLTINASSAVARMDSWSLDVLDPAGALVRNWTGQWPATATTWDGSSMAGGFVTPGTTYKAVATVRDEYGNSARITADIAVAALAQKPPVVVAQAQTPVPATPGKPSITATEPGFSPNGDQVADTLTLALRFDQPSAVASWKVTIGGAGAGVQRTFSGNGAHLPDSLVWDGTTDAGGKAPEGSYTASLDVSYGSSLGAGHATSAPFILDVTPPSGSITLSSSLFSPIESSDTISLKVAAHSETAAIDSWTMEIFDPGGNVFRTFSGKWPSDSVAWNGRNANGELVQSAEDYPVVVKIRDQFGNVGEARAVVPVDILVEKTSTGYRIIASRIFFKAFTADYTDVPHDLAAQNASRLDALAAKMKKFPGYRIRIVGHAVMINWDNPAKGAAEQKEILIPLSKARADAVEAALVDRGLEKARFSTDGVGASDQLVPDSDYKDRWQNRRVALFLEK